MSHEATNWAIKQKGLPPAAKIVLWNLADRHNPDYGCFPSQHALARDCELSRSTLNRHLNMLEERGLIARESRRDDNTYKQLSTRYHLGFESDFSPSVTEKPCRKMTHGNDAEAVSQNGQKPCLKNDDSRVSKSDTNPVREPVREPVNERECASEREQVQAQEAPDGVEQADGGDGRTDKQVERLFWNLVKDWPGLGGMPKQRALSAFRALSEQDQDAALEKRDMWFALLRSHGKTHTPAPSRYFAEKLWCDVPDDFAASGQAAACGIAAPFGKAWGAVRFSDLCRSPYGPTPRLTVTEERLCVSGHADRAALMREKIAGAGWPKVNGMQEQAIRKHKGVQATAEAVRLGDLFGKVAKGSDLWAAWRDLHAERGWPWLGSDRDCPDWVYFPAPVDEYEIYPSLLEAVRQAVGRFEREFEAARGGVAE